MDLVVFSHLRWDFVYQRPQHLVSRFAREQRVWFFEEPVFDSATPTLEVLPREGHLKVCVPHLPKECSEPQAWELLRGLIDTVLQRNGVQEFMSWYYTPIAINFTSHLRPALTVYDCMDELSAFRGAPPGLCQAEAELFRRADLVFTGGQSLYESKRHQHHNVHPFPSSIDAAHFRTARNEQPEPDDQASVPHPRIGFAGVLDERLDTELLRAVAEREPGWRFVMLGPVVKIAPEDLPSLPNIHYLGSKPYAKLPAYLSGWDVATMPFARNEATRYISPTKTPEYLAAGLPVVSTSIRDVVRPYGEARLVSIADTPDAFASACRQLLTAKHDPSRLRRADDFLAATSWDLTWNKMHTLIHSMTTGRSSPELPGTVNAGQA